MSTANLYRHYANKLDIVKACAIHRIKESLSDVNSIVLNSNTTAAEKLETYILYLSDRTHEMASGDSQVLEVISIATKAYPQLIHATNEQHCNLLKTTIAQGLANGEFKRNLNDSELGAFHSALTVFQYPFFVHMYSRAEFQSMAKETIKLLTAALKVVE
jgi:AcrR family transcriptional regulator